MADFPHLLGAAFLTQSVRGTVNSNIPAIGSGSGTGNEVENVTDGAVLGDPDSGTGESGISLQLGKNITEKAVITGSFSRDFANFIGRTIESFSMAIPLKGNGTASPSVDGDYTPDVGIDALLQAAGLSGSAWGSGVGWAYVPAATQIISAGVYFGRTSADDGLRILLKDLEAAGLTLSFTPGQIAVATFNLGGVFDSADTTGTWPSSPFEYGNQSSLSAPSVAEVNFEWGPDTPADRSLGFESLEISIDNETEDVPASNVSGGSTPRQTGRTITITGKINAEDGDIDFEIDQLAEDAIANAEELNFTVGTAGGSTANAYRVRVPDPELISLEPADPMGASAAWNIELRARASAANGEFELIYL